MPRSGELSGKPDHELVRLLIDGSETEFAELYVRFKDELLYTCKQFLNNEAEAEDITAEQLIEEILESVNIP